MKPFFETSNIYQAAHLISRYEDIHSMYIKDNVVFYVFQNNDHVRYQNRNFNKSLDYVQPNLLIESYISLKKREVELRRGPLPNL